MTREDLRGIMAAALGASQTERCADKADYGLARAWERLADAADVLDALLMREEFYADEPPGLVAFSRD